MRALPSGTVTFLFTDVEGSTRLLHELGSEEYAAALEEHRRLLREAFSRHGGIEVDTQGDAFFVAFPTAPGALAAAAELTEALAAGRVRVRVGVHTGTPLLTGEGYVGEDVHRAARIAAAGHGGQVLVSAATAVLCDDQLRGGSALRDLGEHRFKDLQAAERVFQFGDGAFPPLKSLYRSNLPVPATPFLGRQRELDDLTRLLGDQAVRLLTLTGPGGTGKTRLALQAAAESADRYPDGVWWVPLAPLRDPELVLQTVARALDVGEQPGRPVADVLVEALAGKKLLLLLDNAEHLLPALARSVVRLLSEGGPTVLVASRERLRVASERLYDVPALTAEDALALFVARAAALGTTLESSRALDDLCRRLEFLPLAIELAAARTRLFSVEQLLERVGQRLDLLRGDRDADPRQQTLRATIEWSYDLLDDREQCVLRGLSTFVDGWTYEAAEVVAGADPDSLQSLIDKSLVRPRTDDVGRPRYWMLETVREYAAGELERLGEGPTARQRHAAWALELVRELSADLRRLEPLAASRMLPEHANLRAALDWAVGEGDPAVGSELVSKLCVYWIMIGLGVEGRSIADRVLAAVQELPVRQRLEAIVGASELFRFTGEFERSIALKEEALVLLPQAGDEILSGPTPMTLERASIAFLKDLAQTYVLVGDLPAAEARADEALGRARSLGDPVVVAHAAFARGVVDFCAGRYAEARKRFADSLPTWQAESFLPEIAGTYLMLGECLRREGFDVDALRDLRLGLDIAAQAGDLGTVYEALQELAALAVVRDQVESAARLLGASERLRRELGVPVWDPDDVARVVASLAAALDESRIEALGALGAALSLKEAIELARSIH